MSRARDLSLETIRLEQDGRVLTAVVTTPPLNMANGAFLRELDLLTKAVDRDPSIGAVVLTGGPAERFLTHADPGEIAGMGAMPHPELPMGLVEPWLRVLNVVLRFPGLAPAFERLGGSIGAGFVWGYRWKRTILRMNRSGTVYLAAINGPALGGGQEIALACDLRYAADAPHVRMGQIEILAGQIPGGGGTQRLPGILGTARALEHILEGAPIGAKEALELGLVHRLIPADGPARRDQDGGGPARPSAGDRDRRCQTVGLLRHPSEAGARSRHGALRDGRQHLDPRLGRLPPNPQRRDRTAGRQPLPRRSLALGRGHQGQAGAVTERRRERAAAPPP